MGCRLETNSSCCQWVSCKVQDGCCGCGEVVAVVWRVCGPGYGGLALRGRIVDGMWAFVCMCVGLWVAAPCMTLWRAGMEGCVGWEGMGVECLWLLLRVTVCDVLCCAVCGLLMTTLAAGLPVCGAHGGSGYVVCEGMGSGGWVWLSVGDMRELLSMGFVQSARWWCVDVGRW